MFDRRLISNFEWPVLVLTLLISGAGLVMIASAAGAMGGETAVKVLVRQVIWMLLGLCVLFSSLVVDYRKVIKYVGWIYAANLILLLVVCFFGKSAGGSTRWISAGPVNIQPSEFMKLTVILALSAYLARRVKADGLGFKDLVIPFLIVAAPFFLIYRQPDLGTAGVIVLIAATMIFFVKVEKKTLYTLLVIALILMPAGWSLLEPYQKNRIIMTIWPESDPFGAGYHVMQSKIAVGSGMLLGKGFMHGTQNLFSFLPEQHTDFIFAVLSEEWGFAGAMTFLVLVFMLLVFMLNIAHQSSDIAGTLLVVGVVAMIFWHVFVNVGMVCGIMPVVGMPLPLVSYGGSALVTVMAGIGLVINVGMRRFMKP